MDGGPAFPVTTANEVHAKGSSLLDQYFLAVASAIVSTVCVGASLEEVQDMSDEISETAFTIATSMIRRRNQ